MSHVTLSCFSHLLQLSLVETCIALCLHKVNPAYASVPTAQNIPNKPHQPPVNYMQGLEGYFSHRYILNETAMIITRERPLYMKSHKGRGQGAEINHAHRPDHFKSACYSPVVNSLVEKMIISNGFKMEPCGTYLRILWFLNKHWYRLTVVPNAI